MDEFNLARFVDAQRADYDRALRELTAGRKDSHWIWYVFPQLRGLGVSGMSWTFGIRSLDEAHAYLAHPLLGPRIRECARVVAASTRTDIEGYFPFGDHVKVRSSMTLFMRADPDEPAFRAVIDRYFNGKPDPKTDEMLGLGA